MPIKSLNTSNQNFEIAILLNMPSGQGLQAIQFVHCLHIVFIIGKAGCKTFSVQKDQKTQVKLPENAEGRVEVN